VDRQHPESPIEIADVQTTIREFIFAPSGNLFVTNGTVVWEVDPSTGARENLALPSTGIRAVLALGNAADGDIFIGDYNQILRWDFGDSISIVAEIPPPTYLRDMAVESETTLVLLLKDAVVRVDVTTGQLEILNDENIFGAGRNIEIGANGTVLVSSYNLSPFGTSNGGLFTIDPQSGVASLLTSGFPLGSGTGLAVVSGPAAIDIDIKPDSTPNSINPMNEGVIPVAIISSDNFDASGVDGATLRFATEEATPSHDLSDPIEFTAHLKDVNRDGSLDLVTHYSSSETGIKFGDILACLSGETLAGESFRGCDALRTVPDRDGDGLLDIEEVAIGTDALSPDSDWDGFGDGEEVLLMGTDPLDPLDPEPTPVPEPVSWLLLVAGTSFLGLLYRRRARGLQLR